MNLIKSKEKIAEAVDECVLDHKAIQQLQPEDTEAQGVFVILLNKLNEKPVNYYFASMSVFSECLTSDKTPLDKMISMARYHAKLEIDKVARRYYQKKQATKSYKKARYEVLKRMRASFVMNVFECCKDLPDEEYTVAAISLDTGEILASGEDFSTIL